MPGGGGELQGHSELPSGSCSAQGWSHRLAEPSAAEDFQLQVRLLLQGGFFSSTQQVLLEVLRKRPSSSKGILLHSRALSTA